MNYQNEEIAEVAALLRERFATLEDKKQILRTPEMRGLYEMIKTLNAEDKGLFGKEVNLLKNELESMVEASSQNSSLVARHSIDVTAPMDVNALQPELLPTKNGSSHPLMTELQTILDIFSRMGFEAIESREIDDEYHMFTSLNFPAHHPARDEYDTFMTEEGFIAPAHTSIMQTRVLSERKATLDEGESIAFVIPGRVFRNEDLDARHEHTFYQLEGVFVGKNIHVGNLIAVLQTFFEAYYGKKMEVKTQPFYFPFTEPSFEFAIACPFCDKAGCKVCGEGWLEMLGCGMIHPNVLEMAGIDPAKYTGFAWGGGIERLVMIKHNIDDIRYFESGRLDFLRQFS